MSAMTIPAFDTSVQATNVWLKEIETKLGWRNRRRAYRALRAVLHALRDRLTPTEAADLAAQLPLVVRGIFYEGWRPSGKLLKDRTKRQFLAHVAAELGHEPKSDPERVTHCVLDVLTRHVSDGEVIDVKATLPPRLRELWD